jgi:hypothetical protein
MTETQQRKMDAIQAMHRELAADGKLSERSPIKVADRIRSLAPVCNSPKWRDALERYAQFVLVNTADNPDLLDWAYSQGSVYFGYEVF